VTERAPRAEASTWVQLPQCILSIAQGADRSEVHLDAKLETGGVRQCPRVRVRPVSATLMLLDVERAEPGGSSSWRTVAVRRRARLDHGRDAWELDDVSARDVPGLALPREWLVCALAGLAIAALLLARAVLTLRAGRGAPAREAEHRGAGWVAEPELGLRHVSAAAALPVGPVVLRDAAAPHASYREDARPGVLSVEAGSTAEHREAQRMVVTALLLAAMVSATLGTAPLWAVRLFGS
jgi:hypothetical protein